jgi:hypothetical protein
MRRHQRTMTPEHRAVIDSLAADGCQTSGFGDAMRDAIPGFDVPLMMPDAFRVDVERKAVELYEVEVAHALDAPKKAKIAHVATQLIASGWACRLWQLDRRGARVEFDPITMRPTREEMEKMREAMANIPGFTQTYG